MFLPILCWCMSMPSYYVTCPVCKGTKKVQKTLWSDPNETVPCSFCYGKGEVTQAANSAWVSAMFENFSDRDPDTEE